MRSSKTGGNTSSEALAVWHVAPSCWNPMLPTSSLLNFCEQKFVLSAFAFQYKRADFLCPPRSKWASSEKMIFMPKLASSLAHLAKRSSSVYTTIFVRRKDKTVYLSNETWAKCYNIICLHSRQDQNEFRLKRWFFFAKSALHSFCNITMIFKVMSHYFPALFKRIHNHIRSA